MIRIGCAGWALPTAQAARFPADGSHLARYAQVFTSVEINTSFYRSHQPKTYARWAATVPDAFRFSVKMPKTISHELALRNAEVPLDRFVREVSALDQKLGCLLLQLPPSLEFERTAVQRFFALLRGLTAVRVVCEPRHATWFSEQAEETMTGFGVAFVHADPAPVRGAMPPSADGGPLYMRLHGSPRIYYSAYEASFLDALANRLVQAGNAAEAVWCIFDNTASGEAVPNALALRAKVAALIG
ncbi:DUF72 domain-containing protein [Chitinasiproducens palmae]|uniref:DUF72 domain-containing protein n=1 Tax=Chitinasiproducens palmae TaxID=1770053 RepID=UPI002E2692BA